MKNILATFCVFAFAITNLFAQAPEKMNYQGIARDNSGNILANQSVGLQLSIHSGTPTGTVVYTETQTPTTNQFGLFNIEFGGGSGFSSINWGGNSYYLQVEMDASGGSNYQDMGTAQLLSVPYALYAKTSGTPGPTGATGSTGVPGTNGLNGVTGPTGATGADGADGTSVVIQGSVATSANLPTTGNTQGDGYITQNTGHLWVWNGSSWIDAGLIQGPAGATGPTGNTGANGSQGPTGATGADGAANAWGLNGNTGTVTGNFIGTTDAQPLKFRTNNSQRIVISENGNIGIGTTSPVSLLDLDYNGTNTSELNIDYNFSGSSGAARAINVNTSNSGTGGNLYGLYLVSSASGTGGSVGIRTSATGGTFNTGLQAFTSVGGNTNWAGYFGNVNSSVSGGKVYIQDTLSIGTTTPSARLHIAGNVKIVDGTQGTGKVLTSNASGLASWQTPTTYTAGTGLSLSGSTINSVWTTSGNNIYNNNSANVGIGTNTPSENLAVQNGLVIDQGSTNNGTVSNTLKLGGGSGEAIGSKRTAGGNQYGIDLYTANTARLSISNSGNVGIGTTAPSFKLEVTADGSINGVQVGRGNGNVNTNTTIGYQSLFSNTTGSYNSASGYQALYSNTLGINNVASGYQALYSNLSGSLNVGYGSGALVNNSTGDANTAIGSGAMSSNNTGSNNTSVGNYALGSNTNGTKNTAIGFQSDVGSGGLSNSSAIGAYAQVTQSNSLVLGSISGINGATTDTKVGIGTTAPNSILEVSGSFATKISTQSGSGSVSLNNSASVWYFTGTASVVLPAASGCINRRYVIVNRSASARTTTSFNNLSGTTTTSIAANSSIEVISDGSNWLQIK